MSEPFDLVVVGAGAAGLATAIFAAESDDGARRVLVLEGASRIGAKILIAGGGRCNVTHDVVRPEDFQGSRPVIRNVLAAFGVESTVRWFASMGVELVREPTGKLFPSTSRARTILDALLGRCRELGVEIRAGCRVEAVRGSADGGFEVVHGGGHVHARQVALATGGRSVPKTGSDGSGYVLASALGHTVSSTFPGLVPLVLDAGPIDHASLSGISHDAEVTTRVAGRVVDRRTGSLLWTHFGISGPVAMDASRFFTGASSAEKPVAMLCSFLPGERAEAVERWIDGEADGRSKRGIAATLATRLPERVAAAIVSAVGTEADTRLPNLSRRIRKELAGVLTGYPLPVGRGRGWDYAEVTAGGVPLHEVDYRTMESRRAPGLFLVGELLDCDGRIGGFNFQWAWSTGFLAGRAAGTGSRFVTPRTSLAR